ncbi:MAG TPA: BTAD domain-containing putative transcriptional regulator [Gemmatimonadales bacterium]|nr:BTAD domain-containing putative transcriptional regulator [Gemmatimonadales bacterium]
MALFETRSRADLELICFGPPTACLAGAPAPAEVLWRKHLALLIYLALSPTRTRTRQHLLGLLWPEKPEPQAKHSLNEAVRRLRACLGADRLVSVGESLTLSDAGLCVDALRFGAAAASDPAQAVSLVTGDFLEGFALGDSSPFDDWATAERARYRSRAAAILVGAGERCLIQAQFGEATEMARRALAAEPYSEPAARLLIRASALAGDAAGALAAFHEFRRGLADELSEIPSRELLALAERVRGGRWRHQVVRHADSRPPLIMRERVYRLAFDTVAAGLAAGPRTLVITADGGLGRTRLMAECADRLALDGAVVISAQALRTGYDAAWSTLRGLMRSGLARAPGVAATDPDAIAVLAALVPELGERTEPRAPRDAAEVAHALASLVRAVGEEAPLGIALDDAHFADGPSLGALHGALAALDAVPVVLIVSALHAAEAAPPELLALRAAAGGSLPGIAVQLEAWRPDELRELVGSLSPWCRDAAEADRLARRVVFEASGSPFLAVTLLRGLDEVTALRADALEWPPPDATFDAPLPISVPNLARMAIVARVVQLAPDDRNLVAAASALGSTIDLELLAQVSGVMPRAMDAALPRMERLDVLRFDGERYAFTAPLVAQVIRTEFLTRGQQWLLRQQAAEALASREDLESRVLRVELLAGCRAGTPELVREAATLTAVALEAGALRAARRALAAAERLARGSAPEPEAMAATRRDIAQLKTRLKMTRPSGGAGA